MAYFGEGFYSKVCDFHCSKTFKEQLQQIKLEEAANCHCRKQTNKNVRMGGTYTYIFLLQIVQNKMDFIWALMHQHVYFTLNHDNIYNLIFMLKRKKQCVITVPRLSFYLSSPRIPEVVLVE